MKITPDNIDYYHSLIFGEVGVKKQKSAKKIDVIATRGTPKISRSAVTSLFFRWFFLFLDLREGPSRKGGTTRSLQ